MPGKQVTELDALPSFTDTSLLPVHNGAGLKKGLLSQLSNYLGTKFSNPNLLINPDFKINQRGKSTYSSTGAGGTVDRWVGTNVKVAVNSDNTVTVSSSSGTGYYTQNKENISYGKHTYSIYVQSIAGTVVAYYRNKDSKYVELGTLKQGLNTFTSSDDGFKSFYLTITGGSSVTLKYAKVEQGAVATSFIAPNRAEEFMKCERYFMYIPSSVVGYKFTSQIFVQIEKINNMRENATIGITGSNNDTNVISTNSVKQNASINVGACKANVGSGSVGIYIDGTGTIQNTLVGIDFNSTKIFLDAEIY